MTVGLRLRREGWSRIDRLDRAVSASPPSVVLTTISPGFLTTPWLKADHRDLTNVGGIGKASRDVRDVAAMARPTSLQLLIRWKDWKVESFQVGERAAS